MAIASSSNGVIFELDADDVDDDEDEDAAPPLDVMRDCST